MSLAALKNKHLLSSFVFIGFSPLRYLRDFHRRADVCFKKSTEMYSLHHDELKWVDATIKKKNAITFWTTLFSIDYQQLSYVHFKMFTNQLRPWKASIYFTQISISPLNNFFSNKTMCTYATDISYLPHIPLYCFHPSANILFTLLLPRSKELN